MPNRHEPIGRSRAIAARGVRFLTNHRKVTRRRELCRSAHHGQAVPEDHRWSKRTRSSVAMDPQTLSSETWGARGNPNLESGVGIAEAIRAQE